MKKTHFFPKKSESEKKHFTKKPHRDDNQKFSYQFLNIGIQLVFQVARQMIIRVNAARP